MLLMGISISSAFSQVILDKEHNLPRIGDQLSKVSIADIDYSAKVIDLREKILEDTPVTVEYFDEGNDSCLSKIDEGTIYHYQLSKNHVYLLGQDGEQRQKGEWTYTISDVWGRPCLEGTCKNTLTVGNSLENVTANYTNSTTNYGYTIQGISLISPTYQKVTYYDSYDFLSNQALGMASLAYDTSQGDDYNTLVKSCAMGRQTGGIVAIDGNMGNALKMANYYDYRGRNIQSLSTNQCGGMDKTFYAYDFTDHCTKERQIHSVSGKKTLTTDLEHYYDHAGRLVTNAIAINNGTKTVVSDFGYDELGRLANESHGNSKLQLSYTYNIRNWTKAIKGDLFSEQLYYDESHNGSQAQYGGNISAMDWATGDYAGKTRGYAFAYDQQDQLVAATYSENGSKNNHYSTAYSYDLMGNMQTLTRQGMLDNKSYGMIDNLVYTYDGNQVTKVTDKVRGPYGKDIMHFVDGSNAEVEYKYNKNGCMTQDLNKNICGIEYNLLNLPTKVSFSDGSIITYGYSANGDKLSADYNLSLMNVMNGTTGSAQVSSGVKLHRDYCGNFIYEDGALKMMLIDGGYVTFGKEDYSNPKFHFYLKDHLGNNRVVADAKGTIEQVNHYYPFGTLMAESNGDTQSYKYNGKELDRMHGLDSYDYGARWMTDGRFSTPDPHATDYTSVSPYAYCENNPMRLMDKDGQDPGDFFLTVDEAALDFGFNYNPISIQENREYYSTIICVSDKDGKIGYTYIIPIPGTTSESKPITNFKGHAVAATVHTHGAYTYDKTNSLNTCDYFSGQVDYDRNGKFVKRKDDELKFVHTPNGKSNDIGSANNTGITVYVVTPSGSLQKYEPKFAKRSVVSTQLPSDKKDPYRLNKNSLYIYGRKIVTISCMNNIFKLMLNPMKLKRK